MQSYKCKSTGIQLGLEPLLEPQSALFEKNKHILQLLLQVDGMVILNYQFTLVISSLVRVKLMTKGGGGSKFPEKVDK